MPATDKIRRLVVDLVSNVGPFGAGMRKAGTQVTGFANKVRAGAGRVTKFFGGIGAGALRGARSIMRMATSMTALIGVGLGVAGLAAIFSKTRQQIDANAKAARKLGTNYKALEGFMHAFGQTGVDFSVGARGIQLMQSEIGKSAQGLSRYDTHVLKPLGLRWQELIRLPIEEQFIRVSGALGKVGNATLRATYASQLFGTRASILANTAALGEAGIRKLFQEADKLAGGLNDIDAAKVEELSDALARTKLAGRGVANVFTVQVAPAISYGLDKFTAWITEGNRSAKFVKRLWQGAGKTIASFLNVAQDVVGFFGVWVGAIDGTIAALGALGKASQDAFFVDTGDGKNKVGFWHKMTAGAIGLKGAAWDAFASIREDVASLSEGLPPGFTKVWNTLAKDIPGTKTLLPTIPVGAELKKFKLVTAGMRDMADEAKKEGIKKLFEGPLSAIGSVAGLEPPPPKWGDRFLKFLEDAAKNVPKLNNTPFMEIDDALEDIGTEADTATEGVNDFVDSLKELERGSAGVGKLSRMAIGIGGDFKKAAKEAKKMVEAPAVDVTKGADRLALSANVAAAVNDVSIAVGVPELPQLEVEELPKLEVDASKLPKLAQGPDGWDARVNRGWDARMNRGASAVVPEEGAIPAAANSILMGPESIARSIGQAVTAMRGKRGPGATADAPNDGTGGWRALLREERAKLDPVSKLGQRSREAEMARVKRVAFLRGDPPEFEGNPGTGGWRKGLFEERQALQARESGASVGVGDKEYQRRHLELMQQLISTIDALAMH